MQAQGSQWIKVSSRQSAANSRQLKVVRRKTLRPPLGRFGRSGGYDQYTGNGLGAQARRLPAKRRRPTHGQAGLRQLRI